ncbi:AzlD domain-containing protein [Nocardioides albidus]|uniref:AzlD domain-containing protein n=1 Tax=Nocardioides albidus TaxID=1517589 RepID=A0A5C4WM13_9ACTN|nr:AzlD domain-containing protein [Nocardioides albidus]TNM48289.1 AzlD domain-containing protein [Nocardioides albidus]
MSAFLAIVAVGLGTFACRAVFIIGLARRALPAPVLHALEYVGPATLSALIVAMMISDGHVEVGAAELAGLGVAAAIGLRTTNLTLILFAGMCAYWGVRAI